MTIVNFIGKIRKLKFIGRVFHTLDYCLQKELSDCDTVLDLGCGPSSPLQYCKTIRYSVGVEAFAPYLEKARKNRIHTQYLQQTIEELDFPENSFDAVIMIEVLEHLSKEVGEEILRKAERWAKKKVVVSTPNGYFPMDAVDNNEHQKHLSGWSVQEFENRRFLVYGMSGFKFFYCAENTVHSLVKKDAGFSNIRFRPKTFFYLVNGVAQIFGYYFPGLSFGLFAVKMK